MAATLESVQFLVGIHKDQTALLYNLWAVLQGLSVVLAGFAVSQEYIRNSKWILGCFTVTILAFSAGNHAAILRAQVLVEASAAKLVELADKYPDLSSTLGKFAAPDTHALSLFHWIFVTGCALGVWVPFIDAKLKERRNPPRGMPHVPFSPRR